MNIYKYLNSLTKQFKYFSYTKQETYINPKTVIKPNKYFSDKIYKNIVKKYEKTIKFTIYYKERVCCYLNLHHMKYSRYKPEYIYKELFYLLLMYDKITKIIPTIDIYLTNFKKKLPKTTNFDEYNVNSGYTYDNHIVIYRSEEVIKVLIHELLHLFKIYSLNTVEDTLFNKNMLVIIKQKAFIIPEEVVVETISRMLCVLINNDNYANKNYILKELTQIKDIFKNKDNMIHKTNIISYKLFPNLILMDFKNFLKICEHFNENHIFIKDTKNFIKSVLYIIENSWLTLNKTTFD